MSTEIALANSKELSFNQINDIAEIFQQSGMFSDTKGKAAAFVKILAGQELGIPAFASMSGIHVIQGKPTVGAGLMAGRVKASSKYNYKIIQADDKACILDFYENDKKVGTEKFTIEDARKAQTKNLDKFPKNMLFARAISNAVKFYAPDLYSMSVYVPEEMEVIDIPHDEIKEPLPPIQEEEQFQTYEEEPPKDETPVHKLKPKASATALASAIERIKNGEPNVIPKLEDYFALTEAQLEELRAAMPTLKEAKEETPAKEDVNGLKPITDAQFRAMFKLFKTGENPNVLIEARQLFTFKEEYENKIAQIVNDKYNGVEPTELEENGN